MKLSHIHTRRVTAIAAAWILAVVACGPTRAATLSATPSTTLDFGSVAIGNTSELVLTVTATLDAGDHTAEGWSTFPGSLLPPFSYVDEADCFAGGSLVCTIDFYFSPSAMVLSTSTLSIDFTFFPVSGPQVISVTENLLGNAPVATPLPAALPLFATGLGALGLLGWRRKRKSAASLTAA
jgi:hypothetical protein